MLAARQKGLDIIEQSHTPYNGYIVQRKIHHTQWTRAESQIEARPFCSCTQGHTEIYHHQQNIPINSRTKMPLPTRAEFLATGLVPVQNTTDACSMCLLEPMDSPVQLPCEHAFCKSDITEWLEQHATCPCCRKTLFTTEKVNTPGRFDTRRHDQAIRALRVSGLAHASTVGTPFPDSASFSNVETFNASIPLDRTQLVRRTAARAFEFVFANSPPRTVGIARFQNNTLGTNLIAVANMLKHMASQLDRQGPYTAAGNPWAQIVVAVWQILSPMQGAEVAARPLPGLVMANLRGRFAAQMDGPVGAFFRDEAAANDLEMLIAFVVSEAKQQYLQEIGILRVRATQTEPVPTASPNATAGMAPAGILSRVRAAFNNLTR
jgi:hypothetical protein